MLTGLLLPARLEGLPEALALGDPGALGGIGSVRSLHLGAASKCGALGQHRFSRSQGYGTVGRRWAPWDC